MTRLVAIQTDITTVEVDAIVNAANSSLLGGGGLVLDLILERAVHQSSSLQSFPLFHCLPDKLRCFPVFLLMFSLCLHLLIVWHHPVLHFLRSMLEGIVMLVKKQWGFMFSGEC
ncbi:hypothetical protein [Vibrio toranzoniae]|uniref:hypothetical protein n=1 Tax=Vibrio toranzoniae TaxID=1194427 RepID=UPI001929B048|nr:hypothetical protein [Vibrio toranzoniae]